MSVFNALVFDGINSLNYGVYITGEAVFNSPQRSVEAVTVPGRNGDVLLDLGRYENIEVTYHAGVFGVDQSEFATKIRTFRNLLASRVGYKRITDTYNPNEYRMGTFIASVDVTPTSMDRHGEFDIVFNCKPQRFLTSGETAITVADGDTVTNPTLFNSQPMLEVKGYGTIKFFKYTIVLTNETIGDVHIADAKAATYGTALVQTDKFNEGDTITFGGMSYTAKVRIRESGTRILQITSIGTVTNSQPNASATATISGGDILYVSVEVGSADLTMSESTFTNTTTIPCNVIDSNGNPQTITAQVHTNYIISDSTILSAYTQFQCVMTYGFGTRSSTSLGVLATTESGSGHIGAIDGVSTVSLLGDPTYIDCEIGEAYKRGAYGTYISLNEYIDLGSDLPTLSYVSANNKFKLDDTITELKVVPRWWIL